MRTYNELRVLIHCPTGRDGVLAQQVLDHAGTDVESCETFQYLCDQIEEGCGAILVATEGMSEELLVMLRSRLANQPRWSDIPLIILNGPHQQRVDDHRDRFVDLLPAATVLDRPVRKDLLVRAVRVALRTRQRQYELRDHLEEKEEILSAMARANAAKDEFLALVSHELRTPASTIFGGARLLRVRGEILQEDEKRELLSDMEVESERLCHMIQNLLFLARADTEKFRPVEPTLVQREIPNIVGTFQPLRDRRHIELDFDEGLPAAACTADFLHHILTNLLSNADKYSPMGEPIEVRACSDGENVEVIVSDHGPGVASADVNRIFDRFYRVQAQAKLVRGMGLGLTVCRRLVDAQNGEIWAKPRPDGHGLEMHVRFRVYDPGFDLLD
jgi:signal transduction histidine kinase